MKKYLISMAHNMSFDVSLIIKDLHLSEADVDILAVSESHLLKVRINYLYFQDSLSIMNASLSKVVQSYRRGLVMPCSTPERW